jgi:hypothetical protein
MSGEAKKTWKDKWYAKYATPRKYTQLFAIATIFAGAMGLFGLLLSFRVATTGLTKDIDASSNKAGEGKGVDGDDLPKDFFTSWFYASIALALVQSLQLVFDVTYVSWWERELHIMLSDKNTKKTACAKYERKLKICFWIFFLVHLLCLLPHLGNLAGASTILMAVSKDAAVGFAAGNVFFSCFIVLGSLFIAIKYFLGIGYFMRACRTSVLVLENPFDDSKGMTASAQPTLYVAGKMH